MLPVNAGANSRTGVYNRSSTSHWKSMNDRTETLLASLAGLAAFRDTDGSLDDNLQKLSAIAAEVLDARNCSVMLISEDFSLRVCANHGNLPDAAYREPVRKGEGISGYVASSGEPLLVEDIGNSPFAGYARHPSSPDRSMVCSPIMIDANVIGVVNINGRSHPFRMEDLKALEIIAMFMGKAIQVFQLRGVLNSRFAQMSLLGSNEKVEKLVWEAQHPEKMAKILAKSFYKEMARSGFSSAQIINAATEIISELSGTLHRHKKRLGED